MPRRTKYGRLIEEVFRSRYRKGDKQVDFEREDIVKAARKVGIAVPKNLGDVVYSFRYRAALPDSIQALAPAGLSWIIRGVGPSRYRFVAVGEANIVPNTNLIEIKVPDATPGVIAMYASTDEQALLAKLRYNRLIDIFTGVTCYSLQSHLRTTVPNIGQVETDEIYVGLDRRGAHYVFPVQAKGGSDVLSVVQIEQDIAMCVDKFPALVTRALAAQFMAGDLIALFELQEGPAGVAIASEKHYRLVPSDELDDDDLRRYATANPGG